jgi:hypothetical protein
MARRATGKPSGLGGTGSRLVVGKGVSPQLQCQLQVIPAFVLNALSEDWQIIKYKLPFMFLWHKNKIPGS